MPRRRGKPANIRHCARNCEPASPSGSQIPALARRPFPGRDQPWDVGRPRLRRAPSLRDDMSWNGRKNMLDYPSSTRPRSSSPPRAPRKRRATRPPASPSSTPQRIERLGAPLVADLLRLMPSVVGRRQRPGRIADPGPHPRRRGQSHPAVRRGHPRQRPAAGNEPRFELLNADLASRIEVVRGPQSALWGSEAIGGVVAVSGEAPGSGGTQAFVEGGSHASWRGAARTSLGDADRGFSIGVAGQRSDGIDSFRRRRRQGRLSQRSGCAASGRYRLSPASARRRVRLRAFGAKSEFDGFDPVTFQHADTLDETHNQLAAGRLFAELGQRDRSLCRRLGQPARLVEPQRARR